MTRARKPFFKLSQVLEMHLLEESDLGYSIYFYEGKDVRRKKDQLSVGIKLKIFRSLAHYATTPAQLT